MEADDTSGIDAEESRDLVGELACASAELALRGELLDALDDSIFLHDLDGNILYVNDAGCTTRGYTREEFMELDLHQLDAPDYARLIKTRIEEVQTHGHGRFESVTTRKDGSTFPVEISARVIERLPDQVRRWFSCRVRTRGKRRDRANQGGGRADEAEQGPGGVQFLCLT